MLILLNTGLKEGLDLPNIGINFRVPTEQEKDKLYSFFESKKADSFFGSYEGIKDRFLVIDFGKEIEINSIHDIENFQERSVIINAYQSEKRKVIHKLYFLFGSADIIQNSSFFFHESKIRIIDLYNIDSGIYHKIISEIYTEESFYKGTLGTSIYNIDSFRKFLTDFDMLFTELKHLYNEDYFQYVGELLFHYIQTDSVMMKFSILSSIMEFFLIHGKDKITEQFKFKALIIKDRLKLGYINYEGYKLKLLSPDYIVDTEDLKEIYNYRSIIVHGDFNKIDINSVHFKNHFSRLKFFTSCILHQYILSPDFMMAIKNNG